MYTVHDCLPVKQVLGVVRAFFFLLFFPVSLLLLFLFSLLTFHFIWGLEKHCELPASTAWSGAGSGAKPQPKSKLLQIPAQL